MFLIIFCSFNFYCDSMGWEHFPHKYEILHQLYQIWKDEAWVNTNNDKSY